MGEKIIDKITFISANVEHIVIDECTEEPEMIDESFKVLSNAFGEFSCSLKMATDAFTRFVHTITGIEDDLYSNCPNKRVVHLARYAKKPRVRKKNYNRMIKIAEKEKRHG